MIKNLIVKFVCIVFVIICSLELILYLFTSSLSIEDFSPYIGKTDEELRIRFGYPDCITYIPVALPDNLSNAEDEEWRDKTTVYILRYGNIYIEENLDHKILSIYTN